MKHLALALLGLASLAHLTAADLPAPVTTASPVRIWVDQIGYRTAGRKMAVVASDSALPDGLEIELRDAKTNAAVWKLKDNATALIAFNGGQKDKDSGDFVAQLDFGAFKTPGRYYFALLGASPLRSYQFNIADNPYKDAGLAAWKAFYYNRADGEKPEKYGGIWNHGKAFLGPGQATEAKVYNWDGGRWPDKVGKTLVEDKAYDVHGGWWDAGDMNKYTSNTVNVQNSLLMIYEMAKGGPKDKELNIPESGNGFPDILDEIRCGTEFLIRDHDGTGAAFGRVHQEGGCPPESVTLPVQLTIPNSECTMGRASALAYAAVVWKESKLDDAFAKQCLDESMRSWNLLKEKAHPWPVDPKNPAKLKPTGEMPGLDYKRDRATAAACYFRLTGKKEYDDIVHEYLGGKNWAKGNGFETGGEDGNQPLMWIYTHTKDADPALVEGIKKAVIATADATVGLTGGKRGYGMAVRGFWWGSNSLVGRTGGVPVMAMQFSDDKDKKKAWLDAAEDYVHYLYGRNPLGKCYFSNMKSFGAEHSAVVMFHMWVGHDNNAYGAKYVGEGDGKIGPFPGIVIGGTNGSMKRMVEVLDWRQNPWEFTEPDIAYQASVLQLLSVFTWPQ